MITVSHIIKFIQKYSVLLVLFFLIVLGGIGGYFLYQKIYKKDPGVLAEGKALALAETVGKIAYLPQDEIPTVATVSDPNLLKEQPFFVDAKKGDMLLIYSNKRKAILYDPVAHKIINISSINSSNFKKTKEILPELPLKDSPSPETQF